MKKKEYCEKCGREYDGHYPCFCGSKKFVYKDKLRKELSGVKELNKDAEIFGLGNALKDYKKENRKLKKELAGVNHGQDCSRELLENSNEDSNIRIDVLPGTRKGLCKSCGLYKIEHKEFNKNNAIAKVNKCKKFLESSGGKE